MILFPLIGACALSIAASGAGATNAPNSAAPNIVVGPQSTQTFDWGGIYLGARAEAGAFIGNDIGEINPAAVIGYNALHGSLLFGASIYAGIEGDLDPFDFDQWILGADARIGFLASDRALIYVLAGVFDFLPLIDFGDIEWRVGVGGELAIGQSLSLDAHVTAGRGFNGNDAKFFAGIGLNWHPGY